MDKKKAREYMELAVEEMKKSISEPRDDKVSPKVGAVLIKPDGSIATAFRGELRYGDHAEFTLLERKNRSEAKDTLELESEIDLLVYKLYNLTWKEVKVVDPDFGLSEKEYEAVSLEG